MPTTAWSVARPEIQREFGFVSFATTTNITTDDKVISTNLQDDFDKDDWFNGWYIIILGSNNDRVIRRVEDYAASSGQLTLAGASLSSESGPKTCELSKAHPGDLQDYFNRARQDLFPQICIVRDLQTLVTGFRQFVFTLPSTLRGGPIAVYLGRRDAAESLAENLFTNAGFEEWTNSTTPVSWTFADGGGGGSVTQEKETTTPQNYAVLQDANSGLLVTALNVGASLLQTVTPDIGVQGMEVNVSVWAYCNTASRVSARISGSDVASSPVTGTTHGGTGWELLTVSANIDENGTSFSAGVNITGGAAIACYVDEALCTAGPSEALDRNWQRIFAYRWLPPVDGTSNGGKLEFTGALPAKRRIRVIGRDLISSVSADTDTIEVDGELLVPLYDKTRLLIAESALHNREYGQHDFWRSKAQTLAARLSRSFNRMGHYVHAPNPRPRIPDMEY